MLEDSASPSGPSSSDQPPTAVATPDPTVGSPPSEDSAPAATSPTAPLAPTNASSSSSPSPASEVQQQQTSGSNPTSDSKCENSGATATGSGNNGPGSTSTSSSFPAAFQSGPLKRISLSEEELAECDADKLRTLWRDQDKYLDQLEAKFADDSVQIRDLELKARNSSHDSGRREQFLVMRLSTKEQELQELSNQIAELKSAQTPSTSQLKSSLVDPAVNIIIQRLQKELAETKKKFTETQEELGAWKFTPDSVTGKRLMSKCRQLLQENEDIGKMIASGRLAKLEGELAMQKAICEEMKKGQAEMDDYVQELDEDMEGMQSTIYFLQQQFKEAQEKIAQLTKSESAVEQEEPTSIKKESVEEQKEEETASNTVVMKDLDSKSEPIEEPLKKEDTLSNKSESVAADNEEEEIAEDEEKNDKSPSPTTTRGRRGKATPVKESPRRGTRSKRGRPAASEEESPAKGRPKRRRAAAVQKMDETVEEDGDEEDEDGAE